MRPFSTSLKHLFYGFFRNRRFFMWGRQVIWFGKLRRQFSRSQVKIYWFEFYGSFPGKNHNDIQNVTLLTESFSNAQLVIKISNDSEYKLKVFRNDRNRFTFFKRNINTLLGSLKSSTDVDYKEINTNHYRVRIKRSALYMASRMFWKRSLFFLVKLANKK